MGHIKFPLSIGFSFPSKLVKSSHRIKHSWIKYMFLYRTQTSASRQTEDLILSGRSFIKVRDRIGPKTDPWDTRDGTETGSEAYLSNTLVQCAKRFMRWITCDWTLLSHNSSFCVIASCVVPCQRPLRNPLRSNLACVYDLQPHPGC